MIYDDVVIGYKGRPPAMLTKVIYDLSNITENDEWYTITSEYTCRHIYIHKSSKEGDDLRDWLSRKQNRTNSALQEKAFKVILPYLSADEIFELFERIKKSQYEAGYKAAQDNIKSALGIKEFDMRRRYT